MASLKFLMSKLGNKSGWERLFRERLSEPLHLNLMSLPVALFGSTRSKIYFDLIVRQQHAYCLLAAADQAKGLGLSAVTVIEFGVANGAGLLNICEIARKITDETGVNFNIIGFDTGAGMPPPVDYRDHPEFYQTGWFPMESPDRLRAALPSNAALIIGDLAETVPEFMRGVSQEAPIGFVSVDVDYYSSTVASLKIFEGEPRLYLPTTLLYLDDVQYAGHSEWAGEMLAVREFSESSEKRKIGRANFLRENRLFKRASWISHIYMLHVFDHPARHARLSDARPVVLGNVYLDLALKTGRAPATPVPS